MLTDVTIDQMRQIEEQLNLSAYQTDRLVIFVASLETEKQNFVLNQLNAEKQFNFTKP
jgi:hypothetical protein